jgi:hypothetical protein
MKLTDIDTVRGSDAGAVLHLRHPGTSEVLDGVWIRIAGPDSKLAKQRRSVVRRKLRQQKSGGMDIDMWEAEAMETRIALTMEWAGIELDEPLELTEENARAIYTGFPWIAEQVDEFQADRANFIAKATKAR